MAQVDARKAGKPYKRKQKEATGRKEKDGTEAVIKLDVLRDRAQDLVTLNIKMGQASAQYNEAVKAVAKASGLLSAVVSKYIRSRAGNNFLEDKAKAQQLALVFEELGPLDDDHPFTSDPVQPELGAGVGGGHREVDHLGDRERPVPDRREPGLVPAGIRDDVDGHRQPEGAGDLDRERADLLHGTRAVGEPGRVAEVVQRLVGQQVEDRPSHGESADTRVEDPDRSFVPHPSAFPWFPYHHRDSETPLSARSISVAQAFVDRYFHPPSASRQTTSPSSISWAIRVAV